MSNVKIYEAWELHRDDMVVLLSDYRALEKRYRNYGKRARGKINQLERELELATVRADG